LHEAGDGWQEMSEDPIYTVVPGELDLVAGNRLKTKGFALRFFMGGMGKGGCVGR